MQALAVPPEHLLSQHGADPGRLAERLLHLAQHIESCRATLSKRKPKTPKGYVDGATARVLAEAKARRP